MSFIKAILISNLDLITIKFFKKLLKKKIKVKTNKQLTTKKYMLT